jgi:serine/threonine-protein kinase RsbW
LSRAGYQTAPGTAWRAATIEEGVRVMRVAMTMSLPRQPTSVTRARNVLTTLLSLTDAGEESRTQLAILVSEACANAVTHAADGSAIDIAIAIDERQCTLEVGNAGTNRHGSRLPAELPDPLTVGGRGLPLIAALADSAAFVPTPHGRVLLRITKKLAR